MLGCGPSYRGGGLPPPGKPVGGIQIVKAHVTLLVEVLGCILLGKSLFGASMVGIVLEEIHAGGGVRNFFPGVFRVNIGFRDGEAEGEGDKGERQEAHFDVTNSLKTDLQETIDAEL